MTSNRETRWTAVLTTIAPVLAAFFIVFGINFKADDLRGELRASTRQARKVNQELDQIEKRVSRIKPRIERAEERVFVVESRVSYLEQVTGLPTPQPRPSSRPERDKDRDKNPDKPKPEPCKGTVEDILKEATGDCEVVR